jgi:hypothetical protein
MSLDVFRNENTCNKEYRRLLQHSSDANLHGSNVFESIHNRDDSYYLDKFLSITGRYYNALILR